jgi:hypothetical protein
MVLLIRSEPIKITIEMTRLDRLVEIFCEVDDFCKAFQDALESHLLGNGRGSRGPDPGLADAEIITLLLGLHSSGFKYWKNFYTSPIGEVLRRYFPGMPGCERFMVLPQRALIPWMAFLFSKLGQKTGVYDIDSTALPVCHQRRIGRHQALAGPAARGQTSRGWFFGFKLHPGCNDRHEIAALKLTPGPVSDTAPGPALTKDLIGKRCGDQGYLSKKPAGERLRRGLPLFPRGRKNRKSLPLSMLDKMLLQGRPRAETIIGGRKGRSSLHLPRHRRPGNAFLHLMAALVAEQLDPIQPKHAFFSHRPPAITAE